MIALVDRVNARPPADPDYQVRLGSPTDHQYIEQIQRTWSGRIGFVATPIIREGLERRKYLLMDLRNQSGGMIYLTKGVRKAVRIVQHAIDDQLWLQGFGTLLVAAVSRLAAQSNFPEIHFSLREDIPTHKFWTAIGAQPVGLRLGGERRKKMIIDYIIPKKQVLLLAKTIENPDGSLIERFEGVKPWFS